MNEIVDFLVRQYLFDMRVMGQWWMWACVIPILVYLVFFVLKWAVITAPAWIPFWLIANAFGVEITVRREDDD